MRQVVVLFLFFDSFFCQRSQTSSLMMSDSKWQWENATAGAVAGFATVASVHPLDVVRTRFQGSLLLFIQSIKFLFLLLWPWNIWKTLIAAKKQWMFLNSWRWPCPQSPSLQEHCTCYFKHCSLRGNHLLYWVSVILFFLNIF